MVAGAVPGGDPRQRGTIVGSRVEDEDARRPRHGRVETVGPVATPQGGQGGQHRRCVLADVVATGIDEVAIPQAEPVRDRPRSPAALGECHRPDRVGRPRRERDDPDPVSAQAQQTPSGPRDIVTADEHRRGIAQAAGTESLAEAGAAARAGTSAGSSHGARSRSVATVGSPEAIGSPPPAVWYTAPAAPPSLGTPRRPDRRATQQERVDGQRARAQQPDRRQQPSADDLEVAETRRRVVLVAGQQEGERLARQRVRIEAAEQALQVGGGPRSARRLLERPNVHDDADARRGVGVRVVLPGVTSPGAAPASDQSRSSSRSWTTTTSASTTIRRDILLWPTRRSRKVIGTSRMRAPRRLARNVISIWKT